MKRILFFAILFMAFASSWAQNTAPEGERLVYKQDSYVESLNAKNEIYFDDEIGMANELVFSKDGSEVWFHNLFPTTPRELWNKGKVYSDRILISKDDVCYKVDDRNFMLGDCAIDEYGIVTSVSDVVFMIDGERIFIDDYKTTTPTHFISLYTIEADGSVTVLDHKLRICLEPFNPGELTVIPSEAKIEDYVYTFTVNGTEKVQRGQIAILGDDYYFTHLTPRGGMVKGTREGGIIKVKDHQYVGSDTGYFLWAGGLYSEWEQDDDYNYIINDSDISFSVNADGTFSLDGGENTLTATKRYDGKLLEFAQDLKMKPYVETKEATPKSPHGLVLQNYSPWVVFAFNVDNTDVNGNLLDTDKLGCYIYTDGKCFTFTPDRFTYIKENITFIPWGMVDDPYGDIYFADSFPRFAMAEDMFSERIGAQVVYRNDGKEYVSDIVYIDNDGNVTTEAATDGIREVNRDMNTSNTYDLTGRILNATPSKGVYIVKGKKHIVR